ncbi:MAG TPA: DUF362 domain-containing protein [Longimicrobiales bacterium]|nr:DUF362 domain-containing protein [Longimicrobiales bacterium]
MKPTEVVVQTTARPEYPERPPFHPDRAYPEHRGAPVGDEPNLVFDAVRSCFRRAGLDAARYGTPAWNPLGGLIRPGETVLLKPNMVNARHPRDPDGWRYTVTHGSVIRAVADYVWIALSGRGTVIVADAPETYASFEEIVSRIGLAGIRDHYRGRGLDFRIIDLRQEQWTERGGVVVERRRVGGDPNGCVAFDLADHSEFVGHTGAGRYYGADYDTAEVNRHHTNGRHEYLIAGTAILADVVFSLPKLKTHRKAGITVSLKNLVGINGDKNWLPHHTEGSPADGGDEHPAPTPAHRLERRLLRIVRTISLRVPVAGPWFHQKARSAGERVFGKTEEVIRGGNWWGNDTIWRMCLDLNKIVLYGNPDGTLRPPALGQQKRHFALVDAVIAGEGRGPTNPDPVHAGVIVFGIHPASVDACCAYLMGYDPDRIPIVRQAFRCREHPLTDWGWREITVRSDRPVWNGTLGALSFEHSLRFEPHYGWRGHIEATPRKTHVVAHGG